MNNENQEQWTELDPVMLSRPQSIQSKSQKGKPTQSDSNLPLFFKILIGSVLGWAGCYVLIIFIIGGGFEDIFDMDEFFTRLILFISFPMGIIIGGGIAITMHKKEKKQIIIEMSSPKNKKQTLTRLKTLITLLTLNKSSN